MARSRLSIHAIPVHDPDAVIRFANDIKPPVILIVNPEANFVSRCFGVSPNSIFSLRNHPLSEQKQDVYNDPVGTGKRHAREMVEWCDKMYAEAASRNLPMPPISQVVLPGMNEPLVNTDDEIADVVTYNVNYLDGLTERKHRGSCLEFSVGWPRNSGPETAPEWDAWRPVFEAAMRGGHVASIHEYWPNEGPAHWAGWLCYRLVKWIPSYWSNVPFIMTECGLDDAALPGRRHQFWKDFFLKEPQRYIAQYNEYEHNCRTMRNQQGIRINILGYCVFTEDYGGSEWEGADIKPINSLFAQFVATADMPESGANHTLLLPAIGNHPIPSPEPDPAPKPQPSVPPVSDFDDLSEWTIFNMSRIFGYDPILAKAILKVESGGRAFQNGRPVIRNEVHILHDRMQNKQLWPNHFAVNPQERWKDQMWRRSVNDSWRNVHQNQEMEYEVLEFAKTLDHNAAFLSLGMGAAQVMGFNHRTIGYTTAEQMFLAFSSAKFGAANQIVGMFAYFAQTAGLAEAIRAKDLPTIARLYNGSGQVDYYVKRFKEEIAKLGG